MRHLLIGFGIAGQILLLELIRNGVSEKEITIIDPNFCGGALAIDYPNVLSNTPWWKTRKALAEYSSGLIGISFGDAKYKEDELMPIRDIAKALMLSCKQILQHIELINDIVCEITSDGVKTRTAMIQADKIYLCQGATPKIMDVGVPIIPLKIALDQDQLKLIVEEGEHVTVFGCAHSGVLVIDNLVKLGCRVTGIYRGDKPIKYDRDGAYDGIKGHAAPIADKFLSGEIKINFANWNNPIEIHKTLRGANKVVFACGFERINIKGGENYDPVSGKITGFDNVWGFGIAYPGTSTVDGRVYEDVSVLSFQEQIRRTLSMADKQ